jgi:glycosyltransferase involved in cell wall biosynthesis
MRLPETRRIRFRGQNFHDSWKFRLAVKLSQGYFDYFVAPSKWLAEKLTHATDLEHVHIDLGMDEEKFKVLDIDRREIILTLVARFDPIKGHRRFFKIFSKVMRNWPVGLDAPVLRLIGREENISIPQLRSWGKELEIDKFISIETKRIEQIEEEMNRTTLAIIPSLGSEVICRSAYEFLLCGCPIFVSGAGSLQETIKTPLFGHCYEDRSDDEVAELLLACITDAHKETKEVRAMRSHDANKYYSFQSMGHSLKQLLKH